MRRWIGRSGLLVTVLVLVVTATARAQATSDDDVVLRSYYSGNGLLNRGLWDLAASEYRAFLNEHAGHERAATARYGLAYCLYRQQDYAGAARELEQIDATDFEFAAESALLLGQSRMAQNDYEDAADTLARLVERHPDHELVDDALATEAEAWYRAGRHDRVATPAGRLVSETPDSPHRERAELFWSLADMAREDHGAAAARLDQMTGRFPNGAYADQTALLLAQALHRSGEPARAEQRYRAVIDRRAATVTPDALYGMSLLLQQEQRPAEAGRFIDELLDGYPQHRLTTDATMLRGRVHFELNEHDAAADSFRKIAAETQPRQAEAIYWLAKVDLRQDDPRRAAERLQDAIDRYPTSALRPEMTYDAAVALLRAGDADVALDLLARLREESPAHPLAADALHLTALTRHQQQRYDESLDDCRAFLDEYAAHTERPLIAFLVGENQFLARRYDAATTAYDEFLAAHPDDQRAERARFRLGMAWYQLDDFAQAEPALGAVARGGDTPPEFRAALLALGDGCFQRERWADAERHLGDYVSFGLEQPAADNALLKLGLARHRVGRHEEAIAAYDRLLGHFDTGPHARQAVFERGQALVSLGRDDEAVAAFERVLESDDDTRFHVHALNHLGTIAMNSDRHDESAAYFARVADAGDGDAAGALERRGQALMAAERFDEAAEAFARIVTDHAGDDRAPAAAALEAIALARAGRNDEALERIALVSEQHGATLDPSLVTAMTYEKAWCERDLGRGPEAAATYRVLLEQPGASSLHLSSMLELAELESNEGNDEVASRLLGGLLDAAARADRVPDGLVEKATYRLGVSEFRRGRYAEAATVLDMFVLTYPGSDSLASASLFCGDALMQTSRHDQAAKHLLHVVKDHAETESFGPALLRLGECMAAMQEWDRSQEAFAYHRQRFPEASAWYQAQFGIGWALENRDQHAEAIAAYRDILDRHQGPTAARAQFQIGECLFAQERYDEAARELMKVDILYAYPEWSAAALYEAGRCFEELSDPVAARARFESVVQEHQDTEWAQLAARRLSSLGQTNLPGQ